MPTAQEIIDLVNTFTQKLEDLRNGVNRIIDMLPWGMGWVGDKIRDAWNWLMDKVSSVWDPIVYYFSNLGSPSSLSAAADQWSSAVGGPVSGRVGVADLGSLAVDDNWSGSAAEQYRQKVPLQKTALTSIKTTFTDGISTALKDLSSAIIQFWVSCLAALGALIAAAITAVASTATIFGAPAAPFILGGGVAIFGIAFWGANEIFLGQGRGANSTLTQKLNDNTGYPGGNWPVAAV